MSVVLSVMKKSERVKERAVGLFHLLKKAYTIFREPIGFFYRQKAEEEGSFFLADPTLTPLQEK